MGADAKEGREPMPLQRADADVALKETCRATRGTVPLWPWHRARLAAGGVDAAALAEADRRVSEAAARWAGVATRRARLTLVVHPDGELSVDVAQRLSSLDVVGGVVTARVDTREVPALSAIGAKPADRSWWDAAHRRARELGAHQAVIVGADGSVIDGSTSAVWIAEGAAIITPPFPPAIPAVSAAFLRDVAARDGLHVRVEPLTWERFASADEAFLTNAFGGVASIRGREGRAAQAVRQIFDDVWNRSM